MIVFTHDVNLIPFISYSCNNQPVEIFNLSSYYSGYYNITDLMTSIAPINNSGIPIPEFVQSVDFDIQYASAIMSNPVLFNLFMTFVCSSYEGNIAIILVEREPYRDAVMESLIKYIPTLKYHIIYH